LSDAVHTFKKLLWDIEQFCVHVSGIRLRSYQVAVAQAVIDSVQFRQGLSFVVIFPRQSGKNELQAQIETFLLTLYSQNDAELVKISPTWKPQSLNAMRRLERVLKKNLFVQQLWKKEQGYIYRVGRARIFFLSGSPTANVVGATASTLLECDEAQDVSLEKWDKEINPMAASTNATRVFWGTAWTSQTLLAREKRAAEEAQQNDGIQRVFVLTADQVGMEVPPYRLYVEGEVAKLGREHPFIRTQYFSEEVEALSGMFPPGRIAMLHGEHTRQEAPLPGHVYAFLIDVAGESDHSSVEATPVQALPQQKKQDSTVLTIIDVDLASLSDELVCAPVYRAVNRRSWTGTAHTALFAQLKALAELWCPRWLVIDATGIGAGLASFLEKVFPGRVIPFKFSQASKSKLGWDFLTLVETRRFLLWRSETGEHAEFERQLAACQMEVGSGPERSLKWGVPEGKRDAVTAELLHDDMVISAALATVLDARNWGMAKSGIVQAKDPLEGMRDVY
jgi:hypothetical protein